MTLDQDRIGFTQLVRRPVYLQVADQIREAIFDGRFPPGQSLPAERELAQLLRTGRPSVREALRVLEAEGLIVTAGAPTRAIVASELDRPARDALINLLRLRGVELDELVDLRCVLECAAVERAAKRDCSEHLADARRALEEMVSGDDDLDAYDEVDVRFHVALARASGNEAMHLVMLALRDPVTEHLRAALAAEPNLPKTLRRVTNEHFAILQAVEAGDGKGAAELMERHIRGGVLRRHGARQRNALAAHAKGAA
jgi:GntR family transcriptional regulator, transcriptional repressor for pyruvate dehydrogenase complex